MRAVVRRSIEHGVTDALGEVEAIDADTISVRTRQGLVVIPRAVVVAAKEVPPRSTRRGAQHLAISMDDLERIMVDGWRPLERAELGGWLLRASDGFTGRANSVLPLGDPGIPLSEAVERCEGWYDEHGLRHVFNLFGPKGFAAADDPLGRELLERGYQSFKRTAVLTTAVAALPSMLTARSDGSDRDDGSKTRMHLGSTPSPQWWEAWETGNPGLVQEQLGVSVALAVARAVMTSSPDQLFASLERDGAVVGVARIAFAQAWAGVNALHVAPDYRRTGVARQLMGALADASRARGIRSMYLQVEQGNSAARSLYAGLGFTVHHDYVYLGARQETEH